MLSCNQPLNIVHYKTEASLSLMWLSATKIPWSQPTHSAFTSLMLSVCEYFWSTFQLRLASIADGTKNDSFVWNPPVLRCVHCLRDSTLCCGVPPCPAWHQIVLWSSTVVPRTQSCHVLICIEGEQRNVNAPLMWRIVYICKTTCLFT